MANEESDLPRGDDTGLDPEIKDLEVEAAYATLLARAGGPYELKEWFVEAGFILNFPLAQKKQHMVESDKKQMKEKLLALAQRFKESSLITGTYESISDIETNLEKWECCMCLLKYQERWGNRYWRNKWAKQARGTVLFINPEDQSDVRCISYKLERGAEVSTRRHAEEGIGETQDLKEGRISIFDDETIRTCTTLAKGGAISGHLSSKGDGSYFGVTLARGLLGQIWDAVTDGFASDWVKLWKRKGKAYGESIGIDDLVMVPATQGGIMQGDHMLGYMTTALLVGNGLATREQLGLCPDSVAAMDQYGSVIFQRLAALAAQQLPEPSGCKVVSFENICENRRGLFRDHEHTELACRYTRDRCIVLGLSDCESKLYTPHSAFETVGFEEPIYWLITHSDQINKLIDKLDELVWGSITEADFLAMFPPANPEKIGDPTIDYEGFVFMETRPMQSTGTNGVVYMYRKIKGLAYYKSHKLHADNLPYLLRLGERAGHIFPIAQRALELLSPGVFQRKMEQVLERVLTLLDFSDPQNPLLDRIRTGHAAALAKALAAGSQKLPKDPLVGFEQRGVDAQCKMAVNIQYANLPAEVAEIFQAQFPSIDVNGDLISGLKSIVMSVKPWIPKGEVGSFTEEISTDHPLSRPSITPGLIGAMARLVNNLVLLNPGPIIAALNKAEILSSFIDHIDCTEVQGYLCVEEPTPLSCASAVVIQEILCMYSEILSFLHTVVKVNTIFCFTLLQDHKALDRIMLLFSLDASHTDDSLQIGVRTVRENVCKLLITLLQNQGQLSVPSVVEVTLLTHWRLLISVTKHSFEESKSPVLSSLRILLLKLLGLQLTIEGKRQPNGRGWSNEKSDKPLIKNYFTRLLDNIDTSEHLVDAVKNEKNHREQNGEYGPGFSASSETSGQELCRVLLEVYDSAHSRQSSLTTDQEQALVCAVLSALLALSHAAKRIALQAGLVETTLEHVKHLHAQMNMNSLQLGKGSSWRRKEDPLMIELIKVLQLLRNFLHCNASVKRACVESRIVDVLHKLWSWCSVEVHLLNEVLRLLSTLTAQFSKASAYVAGSSGVLGNVSRSVQSGSTLLHSLIKLTHKTNSKLQNSSSTELDMHLAVLKNMFNLLSNLALSAECRGVLWKTNFFQPFTSLKPIKSGAHPRHKSITRGVTLCWLNVLVSVTFFTDGQQVVVKTPGVVEVLLELSMAQNRQLQEKALLVLRNLCFHGASKPVLLVNEKLLSLLVEFTTDNSVYLRALCLSALCSLLHNCQKAKVSLKKTGLVKKLDEIHLLPEFEHATEDKFSKMCQENIDILRKIFSDKDDRAV